MRRNYSESEMKRILQQDIELPDEIKAKTGDAYKQIQMQLKERANKTDNMEETTGDEENFNHTDTTVAVNTYRRKKNMRFGRRLVLVAVAVLVLGTVTVGAATVFKWNDLVAKRFGASEELQQKLVDKGVVQTDLTAGNQAVTEGTAQAAENTEQTDGFTGEIDATCEGVTINLEQSMTDGKNLYAMFKITAPEGVNLADTNFGNFTVDTEDSEFGFNMSAGPLGTFAGTEPDTTSENVNYWEVTLQAVGEEDFQGKNLTAHFTDLQQETPDKQDIDPTIISGTWDLTWNVNYKKSMEVYTTDKKLTDFGCTVKTVELSPLGMKITYDWPRHAYTEEITAEDENGTHTEEREFYEDPVQPSGFLLKDGTVMQNEYLFAGMGSCGYTSGDVNNTEYVTEIQFCQVVDTDQAAAVLFGETQVPVELTQGE